MILVLSIIFCIGYLLIVFEHQIKINKSATSLLAGIMCWVVYVLGASDVALVLGELKESLGHISEIVFFLLGAMTIVELIDAHDGFSIITNKINTIDKRKLLWLISLIAFFLSAVLDNLTTAIVMVSLTQKLVSDTKDRLMIAGMVVIAANAGGAWSPIGDVTTTMLWIAGKISATAIMKSLFLPSLLSLLVPLLILSISFRGSSVRPEISDNARNNNVGKVEKNVIFASGILALLFVPVFKTITHLPPYMGILFALSILWIITELLHKPTKNSDKAVYTVSSALQKIDVPSVLFFLGILLAISVLEATHVLSNLAVWLSAQFSSHTTISIIIGLVSAVVDNVPLVAASISMYDFPMDHTFWHLIAFCAGTGGSVLIIGSAAGVAAMGIEKIDFIWYMKKISLLALVGYFVGVLVYVAL